jgi:hypothetical protein
VAHNKVPRAIAWANPSGVSDLSNLELKKVNNAALTANACHNGTFVGANKEEKTSGTGGKACNFIVEWLKREL